MSRKRIGPGTGDLKGACYRVGPSGRVRFFAGEDGNEMATATMKLTVRKLEFVASCGAVKLGKNLYGLLQHEPLYITNKANLRIKSSGRFAFGGEQWERMKLFQAAIRLAGRRAVAVERQRGNGAWPKGQIGYSVLIHLLLGDRTIDVVPKIAAAHKRRIRAKTRWRAMGIDKSCEAILDGLEGVLWLDDERVTSLTVKKSYVPGRIGDHVEVIALASESGKDSDG